MKSDEIMVLLTPEQAMSVMEGLREKNRPAYRGTLGLLASRRKLRLAFLDKKPIHERNAWVAAELKKNSNVDVATEVLQGWLFSCQKPLLCEFLDNLGIVHDGEGVIEDLPDEPGEAVLRSSIDALVVKFPPWVVSVYLHLFYEMDIADWPKFKDIVLGHPELFQPRPVS